MKPEIASRFRSFSTYTPIEPFEVLSARLGIPADQIVKLDANENPYGPSPKARQALAELAFAHIYPDPESRALRAALSRLTGVPVEYLMAGAGADELIDLVLRVLLEPGDTVINLPPTFGMYDFDTHLNAGQVIEIPRREGFKIDLDAIRQAVAEHHPKALFITTPNNPDGSLPDPAELEALLALPVLVVIDEAYIEFASQGGRLGEELTRIRQVPERENLVVLRTFSKWAGLAGLRAVMALFPGMVGPSYGSPSSPTTSTWQPRRWRLPPSTTSTSWRKTSPVCARSASGCMPGCKPSPIYNPPPPNPISSCARSWSGQRWN